MYTVNKCHFIKCLLSFLANLQSGADPGRCVPGGGCRKNTEILSLYIKKTIFAMGEGCIVRNECINFYFPLKYYLSITSMFLFIGSVCYPFFPLFRSFHLHSCCHGNPWNNLLLRIARSGVHERAIRDTHTEYCCVHCCNHTLLVSTKGNLFLYVC